MNETEFKGLYYVFEYDIDAGYMIEYVSPCNLVESNGNYIYEDTCIAANFTTLFLCSYGYLSKKFNNIDTKIFDKNLKQSPQLLIMLKDSCKESNIKRTKIDFENIEKFLKNTDCHNLSALNYFCRFANKKIPSAIEDVYRDIPLLKSDNKAFNYLKDNIKYQKSNDLIVEAENRLGTQSFQRIYKILDPMDLFLVTLDILYQLNWTIKFCKNCGLPFLVTKRKKTLYCSYNNNSCKIEGRKEKERNRYINNERNRLYRNINGKFSYRAIHCRGHEDEWESLHSIFLNTIYDNKKNKNIIIWLRNIDSLFNLHKTELFELPDINSI